MNVNESVLKALNEQITNEFGAAYFYMAVSSYFDSVQLPGGAQWMRVQAREEAGHAMKIFDFVLDRDASVKLGPIEAPPATFASPLDAAEQVLANEQKVTQQIHRLYALASEHRDYAAEILLQWFISEQVEEEKSASLVVDRLRMAQDSPGALLIIDHELGNRQPEGDE